MSEPIELTLALPAVAGAVLLCPAGLATPHVSVIGFEARGATLRVVSDPWTAQHALLLKPTAAELALRWSFRTGAGAYPEAMFAPRDTRFSRATAGLADEARRVAGGTGPAAVKTLADHVASLFTYGHVDTPFSEGHDEMPQLCGPTKGSCVDINGYFISALRAAGIEAGYVTGYFIPEEKRTHCLDMHCWVVTRADGVVQEWDIAHHLKIGTRDIRPGLNPKPGVRVPMAHSMGLSFPAIGLCDHKLLGEPVWRTAEGTWEAATLTISLRGYDALR